MGTTEYKPTLIGSIYLKLRAFDGGGWKKGVWGGTSYILPSDILLMKLEIA